MAGGRQWELENEAKGLGTEGTWETRVGGEMIQKLWPKTALYVLPM